MVRQIIAKPLDDSEAGVENYRGILKDKRDNGRSLNVDVFYHEFSDGSFELVLEAGTEQIVVMPGNEILQERGLQGVTFQDGGHVSTGIPLTASCQITPPESK